MTVSEQDKRILQYVDDAWRTTRAIFLLYSGAGTMNTSKRNQRRWMFRRLEAMRDAGLVDCRIEHDGPKVVGYWRLRSDASANR